MPRKLQPTGFTRNVTLGPKTTEESAGHSRGSVCGEVIDGIDHNGDIGWRVREKYVSFRRVGMLMLPMEHSKTVYILIAAISRSTTEVLVV